jgi:acyl carrier protein
MRLGVPAEIREELRAATNMTAQEIETALIGEVAAILSRDPGAIRPDTPLHTLGVDSMSFVEILVFVEKKFGLALIESGLTREDFETIRALASSILKRLPAR